MFTTRENLITPILGSISVHQIFRNCRRFNDLRFQTYDTKYGRSDFRLKYGTILNLT